MAPRGEFTSLGGGGGIQSIWGIGEEWTPSGGGINKIYSHYSPRMFFWLAYCAASPVFVDVTL